MSNDARRYIVVFYGPHVDIPSLERYILDSREIIDYWNYIPLVYIVKTELSARDLRFIFSNFLKTNFLIAEINPTNVDGMLPKQAWEWFLDKPTSPPAELMKHFLPPRPPS